MPPAAAVTRKRTRKRKRRAFSVSSSSSSDSDSDSEAEVVQKAPTLPPPAQSSSEEDSSSSSSSSESETDSDSDSASDSAPVGGTSSAKPALVAVPPPRRDSPSPPPPSAALPTFIPPPQESTHEDAEQLMKARFKKFWMASVADGFKDDLEEIRVKEPNLGASRLALLIDSLASGADVFSPTAQGNEINEMETTWTPSSMVDAQDRFILLASLWIVYTIALLLLVWAAVTCGRALRQALYTTALPSPPRSLSQSSVDSLAAAYGPVFQVPTGLLSKKIILCDPTAIAHFYANAPAVYHLTDPIRESTKNLVGRGLIWADGEHHPIHRQALAPMFSATAVDSYCPIFFNMVNKVQDTWKKALESRPRGIVLDIQYWMNSVVLDSLGVAGFGHDFESLKGDYCIVTAAFYTLKAPDTNSPSDIIFRLASAHPFLRNIPTAKNRIINSLQAGMSRIAGNILERNDKKANIDEDRSILGLLIKSLAENPAGEFRLSKEEILAQMVSMRLIIGNENLIKQTRTLYYFPTGFENTAVSLSWLFVELAKNPAIQDKVRDELRQLGGNLEYSEITKLSYLHSVVYEALRLHPPMGDTTRLAVEDDVIPLSSPIMAKSGETVTSVRVAKGTVVIAPIQYVNTAESFWGPGALKFDPERWWQDETNADFPGNRHLAFGDGPRTCIGAEFSLALIKVVLSVIVSSFTVSLPEGPQSTVESIEGRPRVSGQRTELLMVVQSV
ncbi:cytochrome P450 [Mycena capillaripes]|nr:cytochrome P450 [Mycena capillaripes]